MNDLHIYFLKVSLGLGIIALPYYFLLRNDPNLHLKRLYLLLGIAASWIFPLLVFRKPELLINLTPTVFIDPGSEKANLIALPGEAIDTGLQINWLRILLSLYLGGLLFMLVKNLAIIVKWNITWVNNRDDKGVAFTSSDQVFTIFTRIFVPRSLRGQKDLDTILLHERAHAEQLHFIDLMVMELTLLLTWFNPFSWLISRMIKENHEHLADRKVLSTGINEARYRAQLLNHTLGVNVFRLGNQFNHSLTIKRFKMMKKPEKSPLGIVKIALLIPALLVALGVCTGMTPQEMKTVKGKVVEAASGEAMPGTSVVIANSTLGTVADKDGAFQLNVSGDPDIVFSFVGYKTAKIKASKIGKKPVALEMKVYEMKLDDPPPPPKEAKSKENSFTIRAGDLDGKEPVIVVDGKVVSDIDRLDPENIDNISVIKDRDDDLSKKYKAENGLILITTKKESKTAPKKGEKEVFYVVEDMPSFVGGKKAMATYIDENLVYPAGMKKKGISGEVYIQFLVKASGKLDQISVARSTHKEFEEAALNIFRGMPEWNPGKQRGKPVSVKVVTPVRFDASN